MTGSPPFRKGPMHIRFWSKVDFSGPNGCWEWTSSKCNGYGEFSLSTPEGKSAKKTVWAHRMAYEYIRGPIPDGMTVDHKCRNRACVNPAHLEIVSRAENVRRGMRDSGWTLGPHCRQGHEFTPENTYQDTKGRRVCRTCRREKQRERRMKKVEPSSWDVEEFWLRQDTPQPPPLWKEEAVVPTDEDTEQGSQ